jgi:hypothetical protein
MYKTNFGASLTLLWAFLCVSALVIFGTEVFERKQPQIITTEFLVPPNEKVYLNNFKFFFGIVDNNFVPIKISPQHFNFTLLYIDNKMNSTE